MQSCDLDISIRSPGGFTAILVQCSLKRSDSLGQREA